MISSYLFNFQSAFIEIKNISFDKPIISAINQDFKRNQNKS